MERGSEDPTGIIWLQRKNYIGLVLADEIVIDFNDASRISIGREQ